MKTPFGNTIAGMMIPTLIGCFLSGCASVPTEGVDPAQASATEGYVDFYALQEQRTVEREAASSFHAFCVLDLNGAQTKLVGLKDKASGILRLASVPGVRRYMVSASVGLPDAEVVGGEVRGDASHAVRGNRPPVRSENKEISVRVVVGMVSPVGISITRDSVNRAYGTGVATTTDPAWLHGDYRLVPRTTYYRSSDVTVAYDTFPVSANVEEPIPYRTKKQMPYFR